MVEFRVVMYIENQIEAPDEIRRKLVDALKSREEGCPDFILIDCPAGIDAEFITAITPANEAVLVATPDITSLHNADRVIGLLECDGIKDIKMMVNRLRTYMIKGEDMMPVLDVQEMLGLALLGVIPEDTEVIRSANRGFPLVLNKPPILAGLAFEQLRGGLWSRIVSRLLLLRRNRRSVDFFPSLVGKEEEDGMRCMVELNLLDASSL